MGSNVTVSEARNLATKLNNYQALLYHQCWQHGNYRCSQVLHSEDMIPIQEEVSYGSKTRHDNIHLNSQTVQLVQTCVTATAAFESICAPVPT